MCNYLKGNYDYNVFINKCKQINKKSNMTKFKLYLLCEKKIPLDKQLLPDENIPLDDFIGDSKHYENFAKSDFINNYIPVRALKKTENRHKKRKKNYYN